MSCSVGIKMITCISYRRSPAEGFGMGQCELSDEDRERLAKQLRASYLPSRLVGYATSEDGQPLLRAEGFVLDEITKTGGQLSVCGSKLSLLYEMREFVLHEMTIVVPCVSLAILKITDSPFHVHGQTTETYDILSGCGTMVTGEGDERQLITLGPSVRVVIPRGVPHGVTSSSDEIVASVTFSPGLASLEWNERHPGVRDEAIVAPRASALLP